MGKVFVNIGLSLDGHMAPEEMAMEIWDTPFFARLPARRFAMSGSAQT